MSSKSVSARAPAPRGERISRILDLDRIEWVFAVLLSVAVLFLMVVRTTHGGALWRDECDSIQLSQMPRFSDLLANLHFTAFPILFPTILRGYMSLFGASDFALRGFALLVGIGFVAASWLYSTSLNRQAPLLLLGLIGLNSNFLLEGMAVRGYGLGVVLLVVSVTLAAKITEQFSPARLVAMSLVLLAGTQITFFDGALAPAILLAAMAVLFLHRRFGIGMLIALIGLVIGVAYVPYILNIYFHVRPWAILLQEPASFRAVWERFMEAFGSPTAIMRCVWAGIILGATGWAIWRLRSVWNKKPSTERDLLVFAVIVIVISIPSFSLFAWVTHKPLLPRYSLVLFSLLAVASDLIVANLCRSFWTRIARVGAVLIAMVALPFAVWPAITKRDTNIDILAGILEQEAGLHDIIVVNSWSRGISFNRYYHGKTPWLTVPNIEDHRTHRYDLFRTKMTEFFPLDDLEKAMTATLKSANRVWVVNDFRVPPSTHGPRVLTPAPDPVYGWRSNSYSIAWAQELGFFLQKHVLKSKVVAKSLPSVNRQENADLLVFEGWEY